MACSMKYLASQIPTLMLTALSLSHFFYLFTKKEASGEVGGKEEGRDKTHSKYKFWSSTRATSKKQVPR